MPLLARTGSTNTVLPQIQNMLMQDAYYQLTAHARVLTGKFNGAIAALIYTGYITSQKVAILF